MCVWAGGDRDAVVVHRWHQQTHCVSPSPSLSLPPSSHRQEVLGEEEEALARVHRVGVLGQQRGRPPGAVAAGEAEGLALAGVELEAALGGGHVGKVGCVVVGVLGLLWLFQQRREGGGCSGLD